MNAQNRLTGTVSEDPLARLPVGTSISYEPVIVGGSDAKTVPEGVINWDFFQGALLAVALRLQGSPSPGVLGTAVIIAPGLAVTATHVLGDTMPHLASGDAEVMCIGVRSGGLDLWRVWNVSYTDRDDVAYLSLQLASPWVEGWSFTSLGVTTRCPRQGEKLTIFGFRFDDVQEEGHDFAVAGDLYAAAGTVNDVYHPVHILPSLPFPTIEINCGSLGGMSGGAVLDRDGLLVGMISRGWKTDDMKGPTYAAWIVGALNRKLELPWPPGLYGDEIHILEIPERLLHMTGRDAISVVDENRYGYRVWFE
jgi:Trypsin-like peptidase domain